MSRRTLRALGGLVLLVALTAAGALAAAAWDIRRQSELVRLGTLKVDYVLLPGAFTSLAPFGPDFGVGSEGTVFLRAAPGLAALDAGRPPAVLKTVRPVDSLAVGKDGAVLTVSRGFLGTLGVDGEPVQGVPLPYDNARVAPSSRAGAAYLFEGAGDDFRLYRFFASGAYQVLARSDTPFVAAADSGDDVFAATASHIVKLSARGPQVLFQVPADAAFPPIVSIAVAEDGLVFFSTERKVYAVLGGSAASVVGDSGGSLRWRDGRLYVLDSRRRLLYAAHPADRSMFQATGP